MTSENAVDSFVFYRSYRVTIAHLDDASRLQMLDALIAYALDGVEPEGLQGSHLALFHMLKSDVDNSRVAGLEPYLPQKLVRNSEDERAVREIVDGPSTPEMPFVFANREETDDV